jgi:hypothetical protein
MFTRNRDEKNWIIKDENVIRSYRIKKKSNFKGNAFLGGNFSGLGNMCVTMRISVSRLFAFARRYGVSLKINLKI